jgi:diguanylate cyclase (GGDEF)-like protein/PAS domain S-box-containing protein
MEAPPRFKEGVDPANPELGARRRSIPPNEAAYRAVAESASEAIVTAGADGRIVYVNPSAERLFGYPAAELSGEPLAALMPERSRDAHARGLKRFLDTGERRLIGTTIEVMALRRDGDEVPVELSLTDWRSDDDELFFTGIMRDLTERRREEERRKAQDEALREAEERFRGAFEQASIGMALVSPEGRWLRVNHALCEIVGYSEDELLTLTFQDITHRDDLEADLTYVRQMLAGEIRTYSMEKRYIHRDGHIVWINLSVSLVHDASGAPLYFVSQIEDITERKRVETSLREAEERFRSAFEDAPIGMAVTSLDGRFERVNRALCEITGYPYAELESMNRRAIIHPDDLDVQEEVVQSMLAGEFRTHSAERRFMHAGGEAIPVELSLSLVRDGEGEPVHFLSQVRDISERKRFEGQLQYLADHDALTGLFNRRRFESELSREVNTASRYGRQGALLVLDLDNFKYVNDSLGHAAGDELITIAGQILRRRLRTTDILGRLGGDEFGVILPAAEEHQARQVAESLLEEIRRDTQAASASGTRRVTASMGVALFGDRPDAVTAETLLAEGDIAMYDAKDAGRDRVEVYDAAAVRHPRMRAGLAWEERMRSALENDGFVLYGQPIMPLDGHPEHRYELLLRMLSDDGDVIPPSTFLYVAERSDLAQQIDRWTVAEAIERLAEQQSAGRDVHFEVNLSATSIGDPAMADFIGSAVSGAEVDPSLLTFEVTETAAIVNLGQAKGFADRLRDIGCRFALDDFGAGFASFYYLKHLAFDFLKIDGEFIVGLPSSRVNQLVVRSVVDIARGLGKRTIAEFVGDDATVALLREYGVDYAQGFHIGRPRNLTEIDFGRPPPAASVRKPDPRAALARAK